MRKIQFLCVLFFFSGVYVFAQKESGVTTERRLQRENDNRPFEKSKENRWKGSYLSVSGKIGPGGLVYKLSSLNEEGSCSGELNYGFDFLYGYFFNNHWGLSTGIGVSRYGTVGKLKGAIVDGYYYNLGQLTDDDFDGHPKDFELRTRLSKLEEKQTTFFLDIPFMLTYQVRFGEEEKWGIYGGLGVKLQFPFSTKFKIRNGQNSQLNVSGYYVDVPTDMDMGSPSNPPVPQHGYGTISDPNASLGWNGNGQLKMGVAGTAELGFTIGLRNKTDLMVGGYIDYGFTDLKKDAEKGLFTAPEVYHPYADNNIGYGIKYNGMLNSDVADRVRTIAFGGKIGIRFKL
jgi:hypothetical protein